MHPAIIIIPAIGLIVIPRWWAHHVLKQHNLAEEDIEATAAELARQWLDENDLQAVRVEITDLGDHYDPQTKTIRLSRNKFDRKSLTAITTAAHEVSHAIQHATAYPPFAWRIQLARIAQAIGEIGTVLLITVPAAALISGRKIPSVLIGPTIYSMLGSGVAAQLVALPTELDASFRKALPMLKSGYIKGQQVKDARKILTATSLTYIATSLLSVLHIWPWIGRTKLTSAPLQISLMANPEISYIQRPVEQSFSPAKHTKQSFKRKSRQNSATAVMTRRFAGPLIRNWIKFTRSY